MAFGLPMVSPMLPKTIQTNLPLLGRVIEPNNNKAMEKKEKTALATINHQPSTTPSTTHETKRNKRSGLLIDLLCTFLVPQGRLGFAQFHLTCLRLYTWGSRHGLPFVDDTQVGYLGSALQKKRLLCPVKKLLADSYSIK